MMSKWSVAIAALVMVPVLMLALHAEAGEQEKTKPAPCYEKGDSWRAAMQATRARYRALPKEQRTWETQRQAWLHMERDYPIQTDWMRQDAPGADPLPWFDQAGMAFEEKLFDTALQELGTDAKPFAEERSSLLKEPDATDSDRWLGLYTKTCEKRRALRLKPLLEKWPHIVFTKHYNMGASHYAYTEGLSDAQNERHFKPGASLCALEFDGVWGKVHTLLDDPKGVIRDPDVSYDGQRILFSWKKSDREDDYHLYEMQADSGTIRQLTSGLGFADYEGVYLPEGDIVFNSSRCVQTVDCWWTEVSNLYRCDKDGKYLRRLSFDQVHTNYPTVTHDGRVIYTRWDYNDRGQIYPQPLFQMNPDGTAQTEYYGNNSWFPTTILHARSLPNSPRVVAVLSGHHSHQRGKLAILDPAKGRQEASGAQLIAPVRETKAVHVDAYGQGGEQFQYPYPLDDTTYLVTYSPYGGNRSYAKPYTLCLVTADGRREVLAADPAISCNQPIPLAARPKPHVRPSLVDYGKEAGTYYVQDVYVGPGLKGIPRGTVKELRVVALDYRAAGVGNNRNGGPAGAALVSTPIAIGDGCWDVKIVLGDAKVYDDGSAFFTVPARTPVYFQALDEKGYAVQTMRTWSTLQPGEQFSCVGCHESKHEAPVRSGATSAAMKAGPQTLTPFYGPARGFSFVQEIQPILDRHCIQCHKDRSKKRTDAAAKKQDESGEKGNPFSLLGDQTAEKTAGRLWSDSYLSLTKAYDDRGFLKGRSDDVVNWINVQDVPPMLPPYHGGAARSRLMTMLEKGHGKIELSREEMEKIACWLDLLVPYCGDYTEANCWTEEEKAKYAHFLDKRQRMEAIEKDNLVAFRAK
jgi:hydrazine synthase alpha subunit-like protein